MLENNIIEFHTCKTLKELHDKKKQFGRYRCKMFGAREEGFCEVLIYDGFHDTAELFILYYSYEKILRQFSFNQKEALYWLKKNNARSITYTQAIILIGDAVRQNYKYCFKKVQEAEFASIHLERVWNKEYYDEMEWDFSQISSEQDPKQFVRLYLNAIQNKDAALLFDLMAMEQTMHTTRDLYMHSWNHELEEIRIFDYEIVSLDEGVGENVWQIYLVVLGERQDRKLLTIDLCIKLILENRCLKLLNEQILEARQMPVWYNKSS